MSLRFQAIGFGSITDAESMQGYLGDIASRATKTALNTLLYRPFPACAVTLTLDPDGRLTGADVVFESPEQTLVTAEVEIGLHGETLLTAFTCHDGMPVSPVTMVTEAVELELGSVYFAHVSGFTTQLSVGEFDPASFGFGAPCGGLTPFAGVAYGVEHCTNAATGLPVTLVQVALPAVVIPVCVSGTFACEIGQKVEGLAEFHARIGDLVL